VRAKRRAASTPVGSTHTPLDASVSGRTVILDDLGSRSRSAWSTASRTRMAGGWVARPCDHPSAPAMSAWSLVQRYFAVEQLGMLDFRVGRVGELVELPRDEECYLLADVDRIIADPLDLA
jgi:hypothetical protein